MSSNPSQHQDVSLRTVLDRRTAEPLELLHAVELFRSVLSTLEELHAQGEHVLELRPETILLRADGGVDLQPERSAEASSSPGLVYLAPERDLSAVQSDQRADIYSLGVIFWELLAAPSAATAGRLGEDELLLLRQHRTRQGYVDVVRSMIQEERSSRLASCDEVWRALSWALEDSTADETGPAMADEPPAYLRPVASLPGQSAPTTPEAASSTTPGPEPTPEAPRPPRDEAADALPASPPRPSVLSQLNRWLPWLIGLLAIVVLLVGLRHATAEERVDAAGATSEAKGSEVDLDAMPSSMPSLEDFGYFLGRLSEREKSNALNILADLSSDSRLDSREVASVLHKMLDEGKPPEGYGYSCGNCFLRRLSDLLGPLRMRGPQVNPPVSGVVAVRLDEGFLKRLKPETLEEVGSSLPGLVQSLLDGYNLVGGFRSNSYVRYHGRGVEVLREPAFFTSTEALEAHEATLREPLDAWTLTRWLCKRPPRNRFDPGYLLLYFDPERSCTQVRIPTAADSENPDFRPSPASERVSGSSCGGAPEWVCPNIPLTEFTRARYVPHSSYIEGIATQR